MSADKVGRKKTKKKKTNKRKRKKKERKGRRRVNYGVLFLCSEPREIRAGEKKKKNQTNICIITMVVLSFFHDIYTYIYIIT